MGGEERISDELVLVFPSERALFPHHDEFLDRFKALSTIEELDDDDNAARLAAQARADEALLRRMLRIYGYYDALVFRSVGGIEPGEEARRRARRGADRALRHRPGEQYRFGAVDLGELAAAAPTTEAARQLPDRPGDPLLSDKIVEERYDLDTTLGESGYPFAAISEPELLVDHARVEGDLTMPVTPGGKYNFGAVTSNLPEFLSGEHLADIARFDPATSTSAASSSTCAGASRHRARQHRHSDSDGRRSAVGVAPGTVDIAVEMTPAKLRTLAGAIGYGTGEGFQGRRQLGTPQPVPARRPAARTRYHRHRGAAARRHLPQEQYRRPRQDPHGRRFRQHDRLRRLRCAHGLAGRDVRAGSARSCSRSRSAIRAGSSWLRRASASATPPATSARRKPFSSPRCPGSRRSTLRTICLDPTRGFRIGLKASPEVSRSNGVESFYLRTQLDASYYLQASDKIVLAARGRVASIPGAPLDAIAPSRRLYAGGGGSVRGYEYKGIGPARQRGRSHRRPLAGRALRRGAHPHRLVRRRARRGAVRRRRHGGRRCAAELRRDQGRRGHRLRYYTSFGPLRLDVAIPLNPGPGDPDVGVYVALGHAF
jgi:translocation and assembly module TamA